jgi:ABC-type phosphate transport system permease subunit
MTFLSRGIIVISAMLAISQAKAGETADTFVFAGQSNIQVNSTTNRENAPAYVSKDPGVRIWDVETKKFVIYEVGVNSLQPAKWPQNGGAPGN